MSHTTIKRAMFCPISLRFVNDKDICWDRDKLKIYDQKCYITTLDVNDLDSKAFKVAKICDP